MEKVNYIVEIDSGEVIWVSYCVKNILNSYNLLGYDKRGFYFFSKYKKKEILKIIDYESKVVY